MFHFLCYVNIFQTVFPRVADAWLANFESQLQGCVQPLPADFVSPEHVEMAYKDMELMFRGWGVFDFLEQEG